MTDEALERLRTGRSEPPPEPVRLRAGPLEAWLVGGDLRYLRVGGVEIVRRLYVAVRDLDWNTIPGDLDAIEVRAADRSFDVGFTSHHRMDGLDFWWRGRILGAEDGTVRYDMAGQALADFPYAKIGICVHHPIDGFAGHAYRAVTPGGSVDGVLPGAIGPQLSLPDGTDRPLFTPFSGLVLDHESGGHVELSFSGSLWEMEDQRNWTDASYKSASMPAYLGYRHQASRGQEFAQQVSVGFGGFGPSNRPRTVRIRAGDPYGHRVPPLGLGHTRPREPMSERALGLLRSIHPAHLRVELDLSSDPAAPLEAVTATCARLGTEVELALVVPQGEPGVAGLRRLAAAIETAAPPVARFLVFTQGRESTEAGTYAAARDVLRPLSDAAILSGTLYDFAELNRNREPGVPSDGLVWSATPQVHAADELSIVENVQALPDTVSTARGIGAPARVAVSPLTLRPRANPSAVTDRRFSHGGIPWEVDARQPSLFAAAWTLASAAALVAAGADALTYFDTVGPRGVIEATTRTFPWEDFASTPDRAYPLAIVLADLCGLAGAEVMRVSGAEPLRTAVLAARSGPVRTFLLANLTRQSAEPVVDVGPGARGTIRVLDASTVPAAVDAPDAFLRTGEPWSSETGLLAVVLDAFAYARVEVG